MCWLRLCLIGVLAGTVFAAGASAAGSEPESPAEEDKTTVCVLGGQVVDPDTRTVRRLDVLVEGRTIKTIGPALGRRCSEEDKLSAVGGFVFPGLVDLHVHTWGNPSPTPAGDEDLGPEAVLRIALRAGVMAVLDMTGNPGARLALRERLAGSRDHARLLVGAMVSSRRAPDSRMPVVQAVAARLSALPSRPDFIKAFGRSAALPEIVAAARVAGLGTIVHIGSWDEARAALAAGAEVLTHFEDEAEIPADVVARMARQRAVSIPTMAVQCDLDRIVSNPSLLDDPLLVRVTTPTLRALYRQQADFTDKAKHWLDWQAAGCRPNDYVSVARLAAAGVRLLAGSDTGNLGTFQGFSTHREMELLAEAGVPIWQALAAGTTEAARFARLPWGLRPGAPANFLILEASPVKAVRNTRRIRAIVYQGQIVTPSGPG